MRPEVALLDQVEEGHAASGVSLGEGDHQTQIRLEQVVLVLVRHRGRSSAGPDASASTSSRRSPRPGAAARPGVEAGLDALGEIDLFLGVQQRDLADLLEVRPDGVRRRRHLGVFAGPDAGPRTPPRPPRRNPWRPRRPRLPRPPAQPLPPRRVRPTPRAIFRRSRRPRVRSRQGRRRQPRRHPQQRRLAAAVATSDSTGSVFVAGFETDLPPRADFVAVGAFWGLVDAVTRLLAVVVAATTLRTESAGTAEEEVLAATNALSPRRASGQRPARWNHRCGDRRAGQLAVCVSPQHSSPVRA